MHGLSGGVGWVHQFELVAQRKILKFFVYPANEEQQSGMNHVWALPDRKVQETIESGNEECPENDLFSLKDFFVLCFFIEMSKNKYFKINLTPSQSEIKLSIMQPVKFTSEKIFRCV